MPRDSDVLANRGLLASVGTFNDWSGTQTVQSVFAQAALPVTDSVDVKVAVRNEEYREWPLGDHAEDRGRLDRIG